MVDSNYDNILDMDQLYTDFANEDRPRTGVGAISKGKMKNEATQKAAKANTATKRTRRTT
jgi:hypothetical protein